MALSAANHYLTAQAAEGQSHSKGVFTVDKSLAAQKLGRYQLAKDGSWILALSQVAHRGGASRVRVTIGTRRTRVTLENCQPWCWSELETGVLGGETLQGRLHLSLALVLRFLVARGREGCHARVWTPHGESVTFLLGEVNLDAPGLVGRMRRGDTTFELDHNPPSTYLCNEEIDREHRAELYHRLVSGGMASSIPIVCDGRLISGSFLAGEAFEHTYHQPLAALPLRVEGIPSLAFPSAQVSSTIGRKAAVRLPGSTLSVDPSEPVAGLGVVGVAVRRKDPRSKLSELELSQGRWRLLWVLDGVVVRRKSGELAGGMSATLLISAQELPTDLSGLSLAKLHQAAERLTQVLDAFGPALEKMRESTSPNGVKVSTLAGIIPAVVATGMVVQGIFNFASGIFTIPAGLSIAKYAHYNLQRMSDWDEQLDDDLKRLPRQVISALRQAGP